MIHLLGLILILNRAKCQVTLNMSENQNWTASFQTSRNITFQVTSLPNKYCYVTIELQDRDPNFLLIADYQFKPIPGLFPTYKQGEKIDRISQLENRRTRFLKLKRKRGIIYISCLTNKQNNSFKIIITTKDEEQCVNDCSWNGFCQVKIQQQKSEGCVCLSSFIGNDCHQFSEEIVSRSTKDVEFLNTETIKYFSVDLYHSIGQDLRLEFESDCQDCFTIMIYKTKALMNPEDSKNSKYSQLFEITGGHGTVLTYIPINLPDSQRFLWFAVFKSNSYEDTNHLQIGFNYHSLSSDDGGQDSARLASIIIPSIIGPILLCFLIRMGLKWYRNPGNQIRNFGIIEYETQEHREEMATEYFRENRNSQPRRSQQNRQQDRNNTSLNLETYTNNHNSQHNRNNISFNLDSRPYRNNYSYNPIFIANQPQSQRNQQSINQNNNSNRQRNQILSSAQEAQFFNLHLPQAARIRPTRQTNQIDECSICLSELTNKNVVTTTCGHKFHRDCIQLWFTQQRNCPNCRRPTSLQENN